MTTLKRALLEGKADKCVFKQVAQNETIKVYVSILTENILI
jgi:hypothetical protein